jgi:hypothetical protein
MKTEKKLSLMVHTVEYIVPFYIEVGWRDAQSSILNGFVLN